MAVRCWTLGRWSPLTTGSDRRRSCLLDLIVRVAVHQSAPDRTLAVWLDSAPCTNSTQEYAVDGEHQPCEPLQWRTSQVEIE